ncbi:hypothetical protein [Gordonia amicalis]|uniref:hypothetical protein n=1 Tax=Gordonia amicalis TaxID=89053 RepID=UPI001EE683D4|nr:hypothetical protein [Gordonia amicalis]
MPSLVAQRVRAIEPFVDRTLDRLWDDGVQDSEINWVTTVAQRLPMAVVAELLGFPPMTSTIWSGGRLRRPFCSTES